MNIYKAQKNKQVNKLEIGGKNTNIIYSDFRSPGTSLFIYPFLLTYIHNRKIKQFRQENWDVVYLDETWLNSNHACSGRFIVPSSSVLQFIFLFPILTFLIDYFLLFSDFCLDAWFCRYLLVLNFLPSFFFSTHLF